MPNYYQPEIETMPYEELRQLQNEKFLKQVRHVWDNVPYYREKMEAKGVTIDDIHSIDDLQEGMILPGIVSNITNFGCFVDLGIKTKGLVHISQLSDKFVRDPMTVVHVQQKVMVKVIEIDFARNRIALSMKGVVQK